jgi:DNA repair exonuclease SbcCD ATPase subunit
MSLLAEDMTKRLTAQEVSRTAQDLLKSQERLMESMGKLQSGDKELDAVLEEISRLAKQLGELQQSLSKLASRLPQEFMNSESMQGMDFRNMMSGLNEIRKKLREGDIEGAMKLARELFNQMAAMVAAMRNAHQSAMSSTMGRMQGAMMRSASELQRIVRAQQEVLEETEGTHKETLAKREELLKEKLERFQEKARQEASRLAELFPNQESHNEEGASTDELDEVTMNNLANHLTVKLQEKDLEMLSQIMKLARKELGKKRHAEQEEKAQTAEALIDGLTKDLELLMNEPVVALSPEQKEALGTLSQQEGNLQERTATLHEKFTPLFQLFPSLDPKILKNIREASVSMGEAQGQLSDLNAEQAIPPEQAALDRLMQSSQQMQSSMQQLAQRGQLGRMPVVYLFRRGRFLPGGRLVPLPGVPRFPDFDAEGGLSGLDTEKFKLPGKDDYRVPRRFREEILESLKQGVPDQYKDQIENYFKDLSQ